MCTGVYNENETINALCHQFPILNTHKTLDPPNIFICQITQISQKRPFQVSTYHLHHFQHTVDVALEFLYILKCSAPHTLQGCLAHFRFLYANETNRFCCLLHLFHSDFSTTETVEGDDKSYNEESSFHAPILDSCLLLKVINCNWSSFHWLFTFICGNCAIHNI